MSLNNNFAYHV